MKTQQKKGMAAKRAKRVTVEGALMVMLEEAEFDRLLTLVAVDDAVRAYPVTLLATRFNQEQR